MLACLTRELESKASSKAASFILQSIVRVPRPIIQLVTVNLDQVSFEGAGVRTYVCHSLNLISVLGPRARDVNVSYSNEHAGTVSSCDDQSGKVDVVYRVQEGLTCPVEVQISIGGELCQTFVVVPGLSAVEAIHFFERSTSGITDEWVDTLWAHEYDAKVLMPALRNYKLQTRCSEHKCTLRALCALIDAARLHMLDIKIQRLAVFCVYSTFFPSVDWVDNRVSKLVSCVCASMDAHPADETIQIWGCSSLRLLFNLSSVYKRICLEHQATDICTRALAVCPINARLALTILQG
jgi:hypothetical protein